MIERGWLVRDGVVTLAVLAITYLALDDITTGCEPGFAGERVFLAAAAVWLASVAVRLARRGHAWLGGVSLGALAAALWGQGDLGSDVVAGTWAPYVAVAGAFGWFVVLAVGLLVLAGLGGRHRRPV